jgi:hypothetical protein
MSHAVIRRVIRERAQYLCEYCHASEEASAAQFAIDHILPHSLGGSDHLENLALACQRCNGYRYNFTTALDPHTQAIVPLFNPRTQQWAEHFLWTADGVRIIGTSPIGRATCHRLDLEGLPSGQTRDRAKHCAPDSGWFERPLQPELPSALPPRTYSDKAQALI